ncbi:MAG TPA: hypothetical protein VGE40_09965 [Bacilli bacterium]
MNKDLVAIVESMVDSSDDLSRDLLFDSYLKTIGINKLTVNHINYLVDKVGIRSYTYYDIPTFYAIAASNETNITMKSWTKSIGVMTVVITLATVILLLREFYPDAP